jgi:hypothetical protein
MKNRGAAKAPAPSALVLRNVRRLTVIETISS